MPDPVLSAALDVYLDRLRRDWPAEFYTPHHTCARGPRAGLPSGQLQFHQSPHMIRVVAAGNGWGGTMALACEIDAWCRHTNRWQQTPKGPIIGLWFAEKYAQFEILMENLGPKTLGPRVQRRQSSLGTTFLEWPDGSKMYLGSYDSDWTSFQGIEPNLVVFDEVPPIKLWREMMQRRRGSRACRYVCKATQTDPTQQWMREEIYIPWLQHHAKQGLTEEQAMVVQNDPRLWVWPRGGIHDNPAASDDDIRNYELNPWSGPQERQVRLFGGFVNFTASPVFDPAALEWLDERVRAHRPAILLASLEVDPTRPAVPPYRGGVRADRPAGPSKWLPAASRPQ